MKPQPRRRRQWTHAYPIHVDKLNELKLNGMAIALSEQITHGRRRAAFEERLGCCSIAKASTEEGTAA